jgi:hypothetical protein
MMTKINNNSFPISILRFKNLLKMYQTKTTKINANQKYLGKHKNVFRIQIIVKTTIIDAQILFQNQK